MRQTGLPRHSALGKKRKLLERILHCLENEQMQVCVTVLAQLLSFLQVGGESGRRPQKLYTISKHQLRSQSISFLDASPSTEKKKHATPTWQARRTVVDDSDMEYLTPKRRDMIVKSFLFDACTRNRSSACLFVDCFLTSHKPVP